ncbi:T9SS type A sorting domain-containing protein [candidate division KSB1 bacterium]|nr:T9SS type A sorting domain-containing protein [candidate division KSB1 bacterium]MBL7095298.1 T9SS type A sorting domain-containing protein [candidate division KSB1 bacterium]
MKKKITVCFGILFFLLSSIVYSQTDTLKVRGTSGEIGTENHGVPICLKNDVHLRGIQLTLNYPIELSLLKHNISATARTADLVIETNIPSPGVMTVLIFGFGAETISPDTGSIIDVSFGVLPEALAGFYPLTFNDIYASDAFSQSVDVEGVDGIFAITIGGEVPVELSSFSGSFIPSHNKIQLEWRTESESNNYGFEILRGETNDKLTKIGFVQGQGTTSSSHEYNFIDSNITSTNYFYQLKQIDFDGTSTLSEKISVTISAPQNYNLSQNYPNPFSLSNAISQTTFRFQIPESELVSIKIYNVLGREVKSLVSQKLSSGIHTVQWDGKTNTGLPVSKGVYYYTMKTKNFKTNKKMIILE